MNVTDAANSLRDWYFGKVLGSTEGFPYGSNLFFEAVIAASLLTPAGGPIAGDPSAASPGLPVEVTVSLIDPTGKVAGTGTFTFTEFAMTIVLDGTYDTTQEYTLQVTGPDNWTLTLNQGGSPLGTLSGQDLVGTSGQATVDVNVVWLYTGSFGTATLGLTAFNAASGYPVTVDVTITDQQSGSAVTGAVTFTDTAASGNFAFAGTFYPGHTYLLSFSGPKGYGVTGTVAGQPVGPLAGAQLWANADGTPQVGITLTISAAVSKSPEPNPTPDTSVFGSGGGRAVSAAPNEGGSYRPGEPTVSGARPAATTGTNGASVPKVAPPPPSKKEG